MEDFPENPERARSGSGDNSRDARSDEVGFTNISLDARSQEDGSGYNSHDARSTQDGSPNSIASRTRQFDEQFGHAYHLFRRPGDGPKKIPTDRRSTSEEPARWPKTKHQPNRP